MNITTIENLVLERETSSNSGFNLSFRDRLLGIYIDQPQAWHKSMTVGIPQYHNADPVDRLPGMPAIPVVGQR